MSHEEVEWFAKTIREIGQFGQSHTSDNIRRPMVEAMVNLACALENMASSQRLRGEG